MRTGLFGGSFDPPHRGHVRPVEAAREALGLDRVLFLPTAQPPHKPGPRSAPAHARYAMVELALLAESKLFASAHELTPGEVRYTADTLAHFRRELPGDELYLILGSDSFARLATWRRWREIPEIARLIVLPRPGCDEAPFWDESRVRAEAPEEVLALLDGGRASFLAGPAIDLSSTAIRGLLARGEEPPPGALAPLVLEFIRKYALYT